MSDKTTTYTVILKDSERISIDQWRVIHRTLKVDDSTTIGEIRKWVLSTENKIVHVEISENESL